MKSFFSWSVVLALALPGISLGEGAEGVGGNGQWLDTLLSETRMELQYQITSRAHLDSMETLSVAEREWVLANAWELREYARVVPFVPKSGRLGDCLVGTKGATVLVQEAACRFKNESPRTLVEPLLKIFIATLRSR